MAQPSAFVETPVRMRVVGCGDVAVALAQLARVMQWDCVICERLDERDDVSATDAMVVLSHDVELAGPALCRALSGSVPYVGAMGSAATQQRRHDWLLGRRVPSEGIGRIHGPAGLDIGAGSPREIALAIMAEIVAMRHRAPGGFLHPGGGFKPDPFNDQLTEARLADDRLVPEPPSRAERSVGGRIS